MMTTAGEKNPVATLSSERSGITMELFTDQDAVRVRTWDEEKNGEYRFLSEPLSSTLVTNLS